jgi:hypothetical protein
MMDIRITVAQCLSLHMHEALLAFMRVCVKWFEL